MPEKDLIVVGGGLAGSEAAWQAAQRGLKVLLYEMRPTVSTGTHTTAFMAELVCSNSLGSILTDRASGILKDELTTCNSLLLKCARDNAVPSGSSLAVDRMAFSKSVTNILENHKNISIIRREVTNIPSTLTIIASGPLTSQKLSDSISNLTGGKHLYFYDALAPVIYADTIDMEVAFRASRYSSGVTAEGDYLNCPFSREEYFSFANALLSAERFPLHAFDRQIELGVEAGAGKYFEGCLPVEIIAQRGIYSLSYGPMRPTGLSDPRTGKRPFSVLQLRQDNLARTLYNIVGFQTNLLFAEQKRIFRMVPGLNNAEFARYGQMHRNTYITSPVTLNPTMQFINREDLFFAGQITGVEGYLGNIATGLLAGINASRLFKGQIPLKLPQTTMLGALCHYITHSEIENFQPMKANFGLLPPLENCEVKGKRERAAKYAERSKQDLQIFINSTEFL